MSVSGMKKQLHKASQLLNERLLGAEGTKMDQEFIDMEKSVTAIHSLLSELISTTTELLQPNPAYRARLQLQNTVSRLRGHQRSNSYPQTESMLGECMVAYSKLLGNNSEFGGALTAVGESLQTVAEARGSLEEQVTKTFIHPLQSIQDTDMREIKFQLKKVSGRRLDFDYKRLRRGKVPQEEVLLSWEKFHSAKELAESSMFTLLHNDTGQLSCLSSLLVSLLDFHRNSHHILMGVHGNLQARLTAASNRPERRFRGTKVRVRSEHNGSILTFHQPDGINTHTVTAGEQVTMIPPELNSPTACYEYPCCRAVYSFRSSSPSELDFSEGDVIALTEKLDSDWFRGTLQGNTGLIPANYVDVIVPLPLT